MIGASGGSGRFREEFDPPLGEGSVVKGSDGIAATHCDQSGARGSGHGEGPGTRCASKTSPNV